MATERHPFRAKPHNDVAYVFTLFTEGLAGVRDGEKWSYIDTAGKVVNLPQYAEVLGLREIPKNLHNSLKGWFRLVALATNCSRCLAVSWPVHGIGKR